MRRALLAAAALLAVALPAAEAARTTLRATRPGAPPLTLRAASSQEHWVISVLEGGIESQRIEVQSDLPDVLPWLADTNGDGAADLWVPVIGGNANTAWDVWIMQPGEARFRRAGEVGGLGFSRDSAGRLIALGRNGCCSLSYTFHTFDAEGRLREAFSVERQLDDLGRGTCEPVAIAMEPPAAAVRATCALRPGQMPGTPLRGR
ncbi:hypothetical protein GXW74_21655 [Roseomonas eburnea]|uniref:VCBS repeat-containing protein n=1 Tax=Neoroseomonas eburnea TaxID=1346889 RepID=A0A9X9XHC5_9PROT|nr:hypothetical protein [Neoroseomonas eburnea]MBR0683111.1 hypothetical protein [Neoroseomonas eburnea]